MPAWSQSEAARNRPGDWVWPPSIVIPLLLMAILYGLGTARMLHLGIRARVLLWPMLAFALGWISLVLALDSPVHELSEQLFRVHMTQHEILMLVSAPLLVLGRPLVPLLWALSPSWRRRLASFAQLRSFKNLWS